MFDLSQLHLNLQLYVLRHDQHGAAPSSHRQPPPRSGGLDVVACS